MIGVCTACTGMYETTEEDASAPGRRCPGCHFLLEALEQLEVARGELSRAWAASERVRTPRLAEASNLMERAARKLRKEARP